MRSTFMSPIKRDTGLHSRRPTDHSAPYIAVTRTPRRDPSVSVGRNLALIAEHEEYLRYLARPAMYEFVPEIVDTMREDYLTRHRLIEHTCERGHVVHTPFDQPGPLNACTACGMSSIDQTLREKYGMPGTGPVTAQERLLMAIFGPVS